MSTRGPFATPEVDGRRVGKGSAPIGEFTYSVVEIATPGPGQERRNQRRVRTRLHEGTIANSGAPRPVDCRILNQSRTGLLLRLSRAVALPQRFVLTDPAADTCFDLKLMWQNGLNAGVRVLSQRDKGSADSKR